MANVGHRVLVSLLALIHVLSACFVLAPNSIQASETPTILPVTVAPTEYLSPPVTGLNILKSRLTTYFTKQYPAYDFSPHMVLLSQRIMSDEEFGIVCPGWGREP